MRLLLFLSSSLLLLLVGKRTDVDVEECTEMATDLATLYPPPLKHITLIQSRLLMPRFHPALHDLVLRRLEELGVEVVLGTRAEVPEGGWEGVNESGKGGKVRLTDGREVEADYVVRSRPLFSYRPEDCKIDAPAWGRSTPSAKRPTRPSSPPSRPPRFSPQATSASRPPFSSPPPRHQKPPHSEVRCSHWET